MCVGGVFVLKNTWNYKHCWWLLSFLQRRLLGVGMSLGPPPREETDQRPLAPPAPPPSLIHWQPPRGRRGVAKAGRGRVGALSRGLDPLLRRGGEGGGGGGSKEGGDSVPGSKVGRAWPPGAGSNAGLGVTGARVGASMCPCLCDTLRVALTECGKFCSSQSPGVWASWGGKGMGQLQAGSQQLPRPGAQGHERLGLGALGATEGPSTTPQAGGHHTVLGRGLGPWCYHLL